MAGLLRALRLVEKGRAPAAFIRRRGISAPPGRFMRRSVTNSAVPLAGPCASCEKQILDLRKEIMADNHRVWKMYDDLLEVNRSMVKKMGEIEAKAAERQLAAVENMVKTSYTILASGGAFMLGMFGVMSPLLKAAWQQETIEAMEKKVRLRRVDTVIEDTSAQKGKGVKAAKGPPSAKVGEGTTRVDDGSVATDGSGKGNKGRKPPSASGHETVGPIATDDSGMTKKGGKAESA